MAVSVSRFFDELRKKRVVFIGVGVSHTRLIEKFLEKGIGVTVCDKRSAEQMGETYESLLKQGAKFRLGEGYLEALDDADVIFRTPGMYFNSPALSEARKKGKVVTSEMECFFDLCPCRIYAVTGSDGKTTTTTLISKFLEAQGKRVWLGGNIGKALLPEIEEVKEDDAAVVELSSFQLISMRRSPDVAVITNVAPNHLDVHKDMQEYIDSKKNLYLHQNAFSRTVLNLDNDVTRSFAPEVRGELSFFSRREMPENGAFLDEDGVLYAVHHGRKEALLKKDEIVIPGLHNVENYLAAISAVDGEVEPEKIVKVAKAFGGVEHRIERVRELDGVTWYNDSIASSPSRTIAGLNSFNQKIIIIAGGYDKKIPYEPLAPKIIEKVKALVLMGTTGPKIEAAVRACEGFEGSGLIIEHAGDMEEAVAIARRLAKPGDVVSLSPASASFDKYPNFEIRGRHFKSIVNGLK